MVERVLCMHEAPGSMPGSSSFFSFFKTVLVESKSCSQVIVYWIGGLAHMVERVLCMHEAPGSMPGSSSFFFFFKIVIVGSGSWSQDVVTGSVD